MKYTGLSSQSQVSRAEEHGLTCSIASGSAGSGRNMGLPPDAFNAGAGTAYQPTCYPFGLLSDCDTQCTIV